MACVCGGEEDDAVEVYVSRATTLVVDTGEPQPVGATYESEIRRYDSPTSVKYAQWAIDSSTAAVDGQLVLTLSPGDIAIPADARRGCMDIVQTVQGQAQQLMPPTPVTFVRTPTVVGP